ncbi:MAG: hypothetical protein AAGL10_01630 [Pseudomonadota bacterium]
MTRYAPIFAPIALIGLAACGGPTQQTNSKSEADDFAARINANKPAPTPEGTVAPTVAEPLEGAAQGAYAPGTATDPESATCAANAMGAFIGQEATDDVQSQIVAAAIGASEIRFIPAGSEFIRPDPTSPRLNIMLDNGNIVRDARCG